MKAIEHNQVMRRTNDGRRSLSFLAVAMNSDRVEGPAGEQDPGVVVDPVLKDKWRKRTIGTWLSVDTETKEHRAIVSALVWPLLICADAGGSLVCDQHSKLYRVCTSSFKMQVELRSSCKKLVAGRGLIYIFSYIGEGSGHF